MPIRYSSVVGGSSSTGFNLDIGSSGNTTFVFSEAQPAGGYSITSQLTDATIEFYAIAEDGSLAGYTNTKALTASKDFSKIVVYGATNNDLITFEFKPTTLPTANGDQDSGTAPFITSANLADLPNIDDSVVISGGNFATDVAVTFTGTDNNIIAAKSIVRNNSTEIIVTRPDSLLEDSAPYTVTVTNPNITEAFYVTNTLSVTVGGDPVWDTITSTYYVSADLPFSTTIQATDPDGSAVTYSIVSGSLPAGLTLNSSTGEISGTSSIKSSNSVTISATDEIGNVTNKAFVFVVVGATEDVYSPYLQLALPLEQDFNDYSATIRESGTNKVMTPVNSPTISVAQSKFYGASYDSGTESQDKYLSAPNESSLHLVDNDFTIECWVYCTANNVGYQVIASHSGDTGDQQSGWILITEGGAGTPPIYFYASNNGGWDIILNAGVPPTLNAWTHIAVTRFYDQWKLFVNGELKSAVTSSLSVTSPSSREFRLGSYRWIPGYPQSFNGYIQDFRLYNGAAKYLISSATPKSIYYDTGKTVSATGSALPLTYSSPGMQLYINNANDNWQTYSTSLPTSLRNIPTNQIINEGDSALTVTFSDPTTVILVRDTGWSAVDTSGWTLLETGKTDIIQGSILNVYARELAAGTHSLDTLSAMYFFLDCTIV
jgi:hypothetical protein